MPDLPAPDYPAVLALVRPLGQMWPYEMDTATADAQQIVQAVRQADARVEQERRRALHLTNEQDPVCAAADIRGDRAITAARNTLILHGIEAPAAVVDQISAAVLTAARLDEDESQQLADAIEADWDQRSLIRTRERATAAARVAADWVRPAAGPDWRALLARLATKEAPLDPDDNCALCGEDVDPNTPEDLDWHQRSCPWAAARAALDGQ